MGKFRGRVIWLTVGDELATILSEPKRSRNRGRRTLEKLEKRIVTVTQTFN